jgi:hypothetical protein
MSGRADRNARQQGRGDRMAGSRSVARAGQPVPPAEALALALALGRTVLADPPEARRPRLPRPLPPPRGRQTPSLAKEPDVARAPMRRTRLLEEQGAAAELLRTAAARRRKAPVTRARPPACLL